MIFSLQNLKNIKSLNASLRIARALGYLKINCSLVNRYSFPFSVIDAGLENSSGQTFWNSLAGM